MDLRQARTGADENCATPKLLERTPRAIENSGASGKRKWVFLIILICNDWMGFRNAAATDDD